MIRGVTFDWWNTIAQTPWRDYDAQMRKVRVERIAAELAKLGRETDRDALYAAYDRHTELLADRWSLGMDLRPEDQVHSFLEFAGLDAANPSLVDAIAHAFGDAIRTKLPLLHPDIGATLEALRRRGYRIGLVSNTGRTWGRFLRPIQDDMGIGRYFDVRVFSDEVGVRKPNPRIFQVALDALGVRPEETVHIGDDVVADVDGAKRLGMRAVWFNDGMPAEHAVHSWSETTAARPDAEIHAHAELPQILEAWRR